MMLWTKTLDLSVTGESRAIEEPDRAALEAPLPALNINRIGGAINV